MNEVILAVKDNVDLKKCGWRGLGEGDEPKQESLFQNMQPGRLITRINRRNSHAV
jgi:hypothetical protein